MMGTINCTYETPCGWCTKWDKKCDKKIGCGAPKRPPIEDYFDWDSMEPAQCEALQKWIAIYDKFNGWEKNDK